MHIRFWKHKKKDKEMQEIIEKGREYYNRLVEIQNKAHLTWMQTFLSDDSRSTYYT